MGEWFDVVFQRQQPEIYFTLLETALFQKSGNGA
jgi:hypothetical protein